MASCSSPNDAIRLETAFIRHIVFYGNVLRLGCAKSCVIPLLSKRSQMMAELDEKMFAFYYELSSNSR